MTDSPSAPRMTPSVTEGRKPATPSGKALERLMSVINERTTIEPRHRPAIRASLRAYRRAIEAEARRDVVPPDLTENLHHSLLHDVDENSGDVWLHREDADRLHALLAALATPATTEEPE